MLRKLILNLFEGEGGSGPSAGDSSTVEGGSTEGSTVDSSNVVPFEEFIKPRRDEYDKRMQDAVKDRHKDYKDTKAQLAKAHNALKLMSGKYGVNGDNPDDVIAAIENDDSLYEKAALERGVPNNIEKYIQDLERQNEATKEKERMEAEKAQKVATIKGWMQEAEKVKQTYPDFDFDKAMENPTFRQLVTKVQGLSMTDAYLASFPEIRDRAVAAKVADNIRAKGQRPVENGATRAPGAKATPDISNMSLKEINELISQARKGKKIDLK